MRAWTRRLLRRARALLRRDALDRELDDEVRAHIEMEADDMARTRGVSRVEARRQALVAFGGVSRYTEAHRDARGVRLVDETVKDVRFAVRSLRQSMGFTLSSVLVLALGIGSTTAMFSVIDAVLLDRREDDMAIIMQQFTPTTWGTLSVVDFRAIEEQARSFAAVGAIRGRGGAFDAGGEPKQVRAAAATSGVFRAFNVRPAHGRPLQPSDDLTGAQPVAVVSHALAVRALGGENAAVGRSFMLDGVSHVVIGVLPAELTELAGVRAEVWTALPLAQPTRRGPFGLRVVARLAPGASFESAARDLDVVRGRIFAAWPSATRDSTTRIVPVPLREVVLGNTTKMIWAFTAAVALVLLIAVANVASLMLVRAVGRSRELALRTMLGATRARLVRLVVTEGVLLTGVGTLAGIGLGALSLRLLAAFGPRLPRLSDAQLDARAIACAAAVAIVATLVVCAYPLVLLLWRRTSDAARDESRSASAGRRTHATRGAFVVAQFAFTLPLLAITGLLLNSVIRLQRVNPGFDASNLLTVRLALPAVRYANDTTLAAYWTRAAREIDAIPGVSAVGLSSSMPPNDNGASTNDFNLVDRPLGAGTANPMSPWPSATPEYFAALGIPLLEGRHFSPADTGSPSPVAIVSRSWAKRYLGTGPYLGRRLIVGGCTSCPPTVIVGVVGDVLYDGLRGVGDAVYEPLSEGWRRELNLFIRSERPTPELISRVRAVLRSIDAGIPLDDILPMEERLHASIAQPRRWTALLGGFAGTALLLSTVGIAGMLSYMVRTRRREIGVRMALGAPRRAVIVMILQRGFVHAAVGTAIGLGVAAVGTRGLSSWLYGLSATDPVTLGTVTLVLLAVATGACLLPARRAAAIDPVEVMRAE